jgi:hypothetical protein
MIIMARGGAKSADPGVVYATGALVLNSNAVTISVPPPVQTLALMLDNLAAQLLVERDLPARTLPRPRARVPA